jgi:hypothetical protein
VDEQQRPLQVSTQRMREKATADAPLSLLICSDGAKARYLKPPE